MLIHYVHNEEMLRVVSLSNAPGVQGLEAGDDVAAVHVEVVQVSAVGEAACKAAVAVGSGPQPFPRPSPGFDDFSGFTPSVLHFCSPFF